jgi:hypothetical protein
MLKVAAAVWVLLSLLSGLGLAQDVPCADSLVTSIVITDLSPDSTFGRPIEVRVNCPDSDAFRADSVGPSQWQLRLDKPVMITRCHIEPIRPGYTAVQGGKAHIIRKDDECLAELPFHFEKKPRLWRAEISSVPPGVGVWSEILGGSRKTTADAPTVETPTVKYDGPILMKVIVSKWDSIAFDLPKDKSKTADTIQYDNSGIVQLVIDRHPPPVSTYLAMLIDSRIETKNLIIKTEFLKP